MMVPTPIASPTAASIQAALPIPRGQRRLETQATQKHDPRHGKGNLIAKLEGQTEAEPGDRQRLPGVILLLTALIDT